MKKLIIISVCLFLSGCSFLNVAKDKLTKFTMKDANIKCYSGSSLIYSGKSKGPVINEEKTDGYFFIDAETGEYMEVSANCIFSYKG